MSACVKPSKWYYSFLSWWEMIINTHFDANSYRSAQAANWLAFTNVDDKLCTICQCRFDREKLSKINVRPCRFSEEWINGQCQSEKSHYHRDAKESIGRPAMSIDKGWFTDGLVQRDLDTQRHPQIIYGRMGCRDRGTWWLRMIRLAYYSRESRCDEDYAGFAQSVYTLACVLFHYWIMFS